jgi:hypothetical protein
MCCRARRSKVGPFRRRDRVAGGARSGPRCKTPAVQLAQWRGTLGEGQRQGIAHVRVKDKVALITGGGAGIGLACAELFCEEGAKVVIAELNYGAGAAAAARLRDQGFDCTFVQTDVSDPKSVENAVNLTLTTHGKIDVPTPPPAARPFKTAGSARHRSKSSGRKCESISSVSGRVATLRFHT